MPDLTALNNMILKWRYFTAVFHISLTNLKEIPRAERVFSQSTEWISPSQELRSVKIIAYLSLRHRNVIHPEPKKKNVMKEWAKCSGYWDERFSSCELVSLFLKPCEWKSIAPLNPTDTQHQHSRRTDCKSGESAAQKDVISAFFCCCKQWE